MGKKNSVTTILLVDDEEFDRTTASGVLRKNGYAVFEAESYGDAMAVFDMHRAEINFLLADVSLPDGNGCALAVAIQNEQPDLRVLFVSGHVGAEVCKYYGLDVADSHFLKKPFTAAELTVRVQVILSSAEPFPHLAVPRTLTSGIIG